MDQKGLIVDSYCFIAIVLFAISIWSVKVRPSFPELICVSHCCCFFCFCLCHLPLLNWPSTQTDSVFSLCLFLVLFVCLFLISVCAAHLSWACPELVFYNKWLYASLLFFYLICCLFICILSLCPPVLSWSVSVTRCCGCSPLDELSPMLGYFRLTCTHLILCWDRTLSIWCSSWTLVNDVALIIGVDFYG